MTKEEVVEVEVSLDSKISRYWIVIGDTDVLEPPRKKWKINLKVGAEHYIGWWFAGDPGSSYKITLTPATGYEIVAVGKHPIDRKIAKDRFQSSDTLRFFVIKKED